MTNVVLFSRPKSYQTMSMDAYAHNLFKNICKSPGFNIQFFKPKDSNIPLIGKYFTLWLRYPAIARKKQADINHIVDHSLAHLAGSLELKRTVITCHDLVGLEVPQSAPFWKRKIFWKNITRHLFKAHKIIAVSQHTKEDILKYSSINSKDITVIYEGIDKNIFKVLDKEKCRKKFKIDKPAILHIGHSNFYKNIEAIIKAIVKLKKDIKFIKVGRFSNLQLKLLRKYKIDFLQFEYLSQQEIAQIYNAVDLLVYPSWHEGFGFPVLEAMACSCPVVCSNAGSLPELASFAAILVLPDDISAIAEAIEKVLTNRDLKAELSQHGLIQAKKFSWEKTAWETLNVYKSIL